MRYPIFAWMVWMVLFWCLFTSGPTVAAAGIPLISGTRITRFTKIAPGVYRLTDPGAGVVQVSGHDFTVDFAGAKLVGPGGQGSGIHIVDAHNVTVRNADVSGCLWGIVVERSLGLHLQHCVSSHNADLPPGTVIDESGRQPEDDHGGGILVRDSRNTWVQGCTAQHQWDGIDVVRSADSLIEDGDFSYNGNWGLHLWDASRNTFRRNRAIWCTTGAGTLYQATTGWQTYDSQAVGIDHNSNENLIAENDLRFGGDGIFIRANEGPMAPGTVVPPQNGSHRNILRDNDCSFSPNNAIEVDFVDDTVIQGNNCSHSNYGMWLGYSRRCSVQGNLCIDDSSHAVEVENGQGDRFENNVFGFDSPRPDTALVYLRQNGRDKTPSGPYTLAGNVFYGTARPVLLKDTAAGLSGNRVLWSGMPQAQAVTGDTGSRITEAETAISAEGTARKPRLTPSPGMRLRPGSPATLSGTDLRMGATLPVAEVEGIPAWVAKATDSKLTFRMPADLWDRPEKKVVSVRVFNGLSMGEPIFLPVAWPGDRPRVETVAPDPARLGDTVTITGTGLAGGQVLFNGKPAAISAASDTRVTMALPEGILLPTSFNLVVERGRGADRLRPEPIALAVDVPQAQRPHLLSATFRPTRLKVGEVLTVTFVVRNNLPVPAHLMTRPAPPFTYDESQAAQTMGIGETPGALHLRVTSDHPGNHEPGSWPWLFGFDRAVLASGATVTVTGHIRVETPGEHEFRVGLVAGGFRFIDDNAFRTHITVTDNR